LAAMPAKPITPAASAARLIIRNTMMEFSEPVNR
jgi:hypothetical protein